MPATVTASGAFNWQPHSPFVTFGELQATADAGLCGRPEDGITLILTGGYGRGRGIADWPELLSLLREAGDHLADVGAVYGGVRAAMDIAKGTAWLLGRAAAAIRVPFARDALPIAPDQIDRLVERSPELRSDVLQPDWACPASRQPI